MVEGARHMRISIRLITNALHSIAPSDLLKHLSRDQVKLDLFPTRVGANGQLTIWQGKEVSCLH